MLAGYFPLESLERMDSFAGIRLPRGMPEIVRATRELRFVYASDLRLGTLLRVLAGLRGDPEGRRFIVMVGLATLPLLAAGALLADFVRGILYESFGVIAAAFVVGGIVMLVVERTRPRATVCSARKIPRVSRRVGRRRSSARRLRSSDSFFEPSGTSRMRGS